VPARREEREDSGPVAPASARGADSDDDDAAGDIRRLRPISELELPPELPVRMANFVRDSLPSRRHDLRAGLRQPDLRGGRAGAVRVGARPARGSDRGRTEAASGARSATTGACARRVPTKPAALATRSRAKREAYAFLQSAAARAGPADEAAAGRGTAGAEGDVLFCLGRPHRFSRPGAGSVRSGCGCASRCARSGARDGAKAVGGIGSCGRELCCSTFLPAFQPISIRMAKDQGMVLNPSKLAGQCGRLKCCLIYEHSTYKELGKTLPKVGKKVITPDGMGRVLDLDILKQRVRVYLEEGGAKSYAAAEVRSANPPQGGQPCDTPTSQRRVPSTTSRISSARGNVSR
jgi:hypothetical protein